MDMLTLLSGMDTATVSQLDLIQQQLDGLNKLREAVSSDSYEQIGLLATQVDLTRETNDLLRSIFTEAGQSIPVALTPQNVDNSGVEERLDRMAAQLAEMNASLQTLATNARLAANE